MSLSFYFSDLITRPIRRLTREIEDISPLDLSYRVYQDKGKDEVDFLAGKFNELLDKLEKAFKFQQQYINHLSHELKTPLSVMMANVERSIVEDDIEKLRKSMQFQKNALMGLSNIMDIMLEISKMEHMAAPAGRGATRIDEVIFECVEEIGILNNNVRFDFDIDSTLTDANLTVACNSRMVKLALLNLIKNAFNYSSKEKPSIAISKSENLVHINIANDGPLIEQKEQQMLFKQSFRGKNSLPGTGYGLGLVLTSRIVKLLSGTLEYSIVDGARNCFTLSLHTADQR
jgi:signal transduction histidine kinase